MLFVVASVVPLLVLLSIATATLGRDVVQKIIQDVLLITVFCILSSIYVSGQFAKNISKPIVELTKIAENIKKGIYVDKTKITTGDELQELGNTINKAVDELAKITKEHKEIEEAKTQFLSISSHELRSPMTPMKAQMQMLLEGYFGKLNTQQKESLQICLKNTNRLDGIISDLLEMSRIEAARLKFNFKKMDLTENIKQVIKDMEAYMPEKKIKISAKIGKLPVIEVDPDRIHQILRNLIGNAIKFTSDNGAIDVVVTAEQNHLTFSVSDTGIGIAEKDKRKIFEPFFQAEQTIYRQKGGTGLGLAICKGIVESQNGKMWLESTLGKGTTFYFTVPYEPVREIKSIRVIFYSQNALEKELEAVFKEQLGPMGLSEYELAKKEGFGKEELAKYVEYLVSEKVLDREEGNKFKHKLLTTLEKEPASAEENSAKEKIGEIFGEKIQQ